MARKNKWETKVGRDCVSLDTSLARWLSKRLLFLAQHGDGYPVRFAEQVGNDDENLLHAMWQNELTHAGVALERYAKQYDEQDIKAANARVRNGQAAMRWVAEWMPHLWD